MNREMLMSILEQIESAMDDSIMGDVAKAKPEACITIQITGPKGMKVGGVEESEETEDDPEIEADELDSRLASVSKGRSAFDGKPKK